MEKQPKLLVVDDDPDILDAITTILATQPYDIRTARDGVECVDQVREDIPDLIILDLLMPKKDGFAVVRELRENPKYGKMPILILTSVREDASRRRYELETGLAMDVQDYVEKPISPMDLLERVKKLLESSR
ncbi:MAG: response regulator [Anaerolineae bacterium]|nr:response regulator [Anaerolineae bacterium]NIN95929.1 response regulator [Anaerolineae bacterium]NIQ78893.1 response regulator [Anaerolineae bacterium]